MAMITCDECEANISDKAKTCIGCGAPVESNQAKTKGKVYIDSKTGLPRAPYQWELTQERDEAFKRGDSIPPETIRVMNSPDSKSVVVALLLTFFLGPFGLCYVNMLLGLILGLLWLLAWVFTFGILAVIPWALGIIFAAVDVDRVNKGLQPTFGEFGE